jgi:hypothetical protein
LPHAETIADFHVMQAETDHETLVDKTPERVFLVSNAPKIDALSVGSQLGHLGGDLLSFVLREVQAVGQDPDTNLAKRQLDCNSNQNGQ